MAHESRIIRKISLEEYACILLTHPTIRVSPHALFRIHEKQREDITEQGIADMLVQSKPVMVGLQGNGRYAILFKEKTEFFRIIVELKPYAIEIVTFLITNNLPTIKDE